MTRTPSLNRFAALAAATVLGLTGLSACGSSDDGSSSSSSSSSSSAAPSSSSAAPSASAKVSPKASSTASSGGSSTKKAAKITIKDYAYSGAKTVAPGTKVMITNDDSEAHTVTADSGSAFDVDIAPGKTATLTAPSKAGSYAYHCTYHSNMHGTLQVS